MQINSSIYSQDRGNADIAGNFQKGMTIGNMIRKKNMQDKAIANTEKTKEIFKKNFIKQDDGTFSLNRNATLGELGGVDPEKAIALQKQWNDEAITNRKNEILFNDKKQDQANKDRDYNLREKKLKVDQAESGLKSKKIKADQYKVGGFAKRALMAEEELGKMPSDVGTGGFSDTLQGIGFFPEAMKSDERKEFEQTQRNFISAVLRRESGAAISDQEMENESMKYYPQPGDGTKVLAQKKRARIQAINNLKAESGGALEAIADAPKASIERRESKSMGVPGISNAFAASPMEHPKANDAYEWAKRNPNNPKAKQIIQRLGVK